MTGQVCDTHCHLNLSMFVDDLPGVLARAAESGVEHILVPGIDLETSQSALRLADQYPQIYAAIGVHPSEAEKWGSTTYAELRQMAAHPKVMAIGEIGLDYYRDYSPRPAQRIAFRAQLDLAQECGLPVIIHSRAAFVDVWQDLTAWLSGLKMANSTLAQRPGVLHSFDGSMLEALQITDAGFWVGISGPVTFKNAHERHEVAVGLPLQRILTETDAPYLTPQPHRGQRNEPAFVNYVIEKIAALRGLSVTELQQTTWENAEELFMWSKLR